MVAASSTILVDILTALYKPFWFSVVLSILFMFLILYAREHGWKNAAVIFWKHLRAEKEYRRLFVLVFYTVMILFRTLFERTLWTNPLSDVIGNWQIIDQNGQLNMEPLENLLLLIPFMAMLLWNFREKIIGEAGSIGKTMLQSIKISFLFSLTIEFLQLLLHLGTFQLSDLFYNTLGGIIGGLLYWIGDRVKHRKQSE